VWIARFHYHRDRTRTVPDGLAPIPIGDGFAANRSISGQARPTGAKDHASLRTIRGRSLKMFDFAAGPEFAARSGS
jgi:hypothetical protein